jgi:pimeloyl-ACP methyl ester carboxylesterase
MTRLHLAASEQRAVRPMVLAFMVLALAASCLPSSIAAASTRATLVAARPDVVAVPVQVVQTDEGPVAYRQLGKGRPLVLIMGVGGSIDDWAPALVDDLASSFHLILFDNAGIGRTATLAPPLTITEMAGQTSAFISALGLQRVDVLGWSMGGMIAQALATQHPTQVGRVVLAATQPGTGRALPIPSAAAADAVSTDPADVLSVLFPPGQGRAEEAYVSGILSYPGYYGAPRTIVAAQSAAIESWMSGADPSGHRADAIRSPTLVADGTLDALDPLANDRMLATAIRGARLALYPGAGHGFLFQDAAPFASRLRTFLG